MIDTHTPTTDIAVQEKKEAKFAAPEVIQLPTIETLANQLAQAIAASDRATSRELPSRITDRALIRAQLVAQGRISHLPDLERDIQGGLMFNERLAEELPPHLNFPESYFDIFVNDQNLKAQSFEYFDTHKDHYQTGTESPHHLEGRQVTRRNSVKQAIEHVRVVTTLNALSPVRDPAASDADKLATIKAVVETQPIPYQIDRRVFQARAIFDAAIEDDRPHDQKISLLNLALDKAVENMDTLPSDGSARVELAETYLTAGWALHDLASQPQSFLPQVSEAEAREFRVRALEMAHHWVSISATHYRELFDSPIGSITPETLLKVTHKIAEINATGGGKHINQAIWFEGIFKRDYEQKVHELNRQVRSIGKGAILSAIKPINAKQPLQPKAELAEVA